MAELTLGAVSLIGPTYHLYKRCDALVKSYRNCHRDLQKCCLGLSLAKSLYLSELHRILVLLVGDGKLAGQMLEDMAHPMWTDPQFSQKWKTEVGHSIDISMKVTAHTLKQIEEELLRLAERLDLKESKIQTESCLGRIKRFKGDLFWSGKEKSDITALINNLRNDNQDLQRLRKKLAYGLGRRPSTPQKSPACTDPSEIGEVMSRLFQIREVSKTLYESLEDLAGCTCHSINLQLDVLRDAPSPQDTSMSQASQSTTRFRLIFNQGERSACGNCHCTSVIIVAELSESRILTSTNIVVSSQVTMTTCKSTKGARKGRFEGGSNDDEEDEPRCLSRQHSTTQISIHTANINQNVPIPVRIQYSDDGKSPLGIYFTLPDGRQASLALPDRNTVAQSASHEITTFLDVQPPKPQFAGLCSLIDRLGGHSLSKHLIATKPAANREYLIYREQLNEFRSTRRSLESILSSQPSERQLAKSDRLQICLTLSISLLYFASSSQSHSFFRERWRSRDIFFFDDVCSSHLTADSRKKYIPHIVPLFKDEFTEEMDADCNESASSSLVVPNELLFSLAVVLIETAMTRSLFDIDTKYSYGKPGDAIAELITALKIVNSGLLKKSLGSRFETIVRTCISGQFEGVEDCDLTKEDMQEAYYRSVVWQLHEMLEPFNPTPGKLQLR